MYLYKLIYLGCLLFVVNGNFVFPCLTPNNEPGFCTSIFTCPTLMKSLGSLQPSALTFVNRSICADLTYRDLMVCCGTLGNFWGLTSHVDIATTVPTNHVQQTTTSPVTRTPSAQDAEKTTKIPPVESVKPTEPTKSSTTELPQPSKAPVTLVDISVKPLETTKPPNTETPQPAEAPATLVEISVKPPETTKPPNIESPQLSVVTTPLEAPVTVVELSPKIDTAVKQHRDFVKRRLLPSKTYCGLQHTDDRVYTENATALDEHPWLVHVIFILDEDEDTEQYLDRCNGVLISQRYVLTSEYCGTYPEGVRLGQYYTNQTVSCVNNPDFPECTEPWDVIKVEEEIHRTNSSNASLHDFTLLRLARNVVYSDFIRPICLPLVEPKKPPEFYTFSGWGGTANIGTVKKRLHYKPTNVSECYGLDVQKKHQIDQTNKELYKAPKDVTPLCLIPRDENGELACTGDEAGPVMHSERFQWFADGVITRVYYETKRGDDVNNLCSNELPIGGVKITQDVLNWIFDNMRK